MNKNHSTKYSQFFAIFANLQKIGMSTTREELVFDFTEGRTESLRDLTPHDYRELLVKMNSMYNESAKKREEQESKQRRKIIALFCQMGYKVDEKADMDRINDWCLNYGHLRCVLNYYHGQDLVKLVNQAQLVYNSFIKSV